MKASIAWCGITTDRMRYGENAFHELNILEEVSSRDGVRDGGSGSTGISGEVGEAGGGGSSSVRHADNFAINCAFASRSALFAVEVVDFFPVEDSAAVSFRASKLHWQTAKL